MHTYHIHVIKFQTKQLIYDYTYNIHTFTISYDILPYYAHTHTHTHIGH